MECQGTAKEWLEPSPGGWGSEGLPGRPVRGLIPRGSIIVKEVRSKKTGIPERGQLEESHRKEECLGQEHKPSGVVKSVGLGD